MSKNTEISIKDQINEKINSWTSSLNDLKEHFEAESHSAMDEFEVQKGKLESWVNDASEKLKGYTDLNEDIISKFKNTLNDLKGIAEEEKVETVSALVSQHKKLDEILANLKSHLSSFYAESKGDAKKYADDALNKLESFQSKIDLFKLRAEKEGESVWEEKKKELSNKINDLKAKLEDNKDLPEDKWEKFSSEMTEAWTHIKNSFKS